MLATMPVSKKPTRARPAPRKSSEPEGRKKSRLSEIGDEAMRRALLEVLVGNDWSLTRASDALRMGGSANVLRAIRQLGLTGAYEDARARLNIRPGPRPT